MLRAIVRALKRVNLHLKTKYTDMYIKARSDEKYRVRLALWFNIWVFIFYQLFFCETVVIMTAGNGCSQFLLNLVSLDTCYFIVLTVLTAYLILGWFLFFYWGSIGVRGAFYIAEFFLILSELGVVTALYLTLKYHTVLTCFMGELIISDDFSIACVITLDILSVLGAALVIFLTMVALTFGSEYMSREAFAYNVIVILVAFSSSIVWFILSNGAGLMTIFWEFSGLFSLLLVDTFYNRIRTTQAVSRTFAISRFSDYWIFIALAELAAAFDTDSLSSILSLVSGMSSEVSVLSVYVMDTKSFNVIALCIFSAASCKCAQFILFVWLPDAMEAPTPASALIHSSTLVVMGIFMILRFSPMFKISTLVLYVALIVGATTILYGAVFSVQTGDLKKAVAYSTISQIGYLYCGCGLLALRETLVYLVVHAVCKAMLFIFVGYIVHLFGGTTSLRKMGGIFYIAPDVAIYVFTLALILSGAPYTIGFIAKEFIIGHLLCSGGPVMCYVMFCWTIAFFSTPLYLFRICILPIFGRPRSSRKIYRAILLLKNKNKNTAIDDFNINKINNPLAFFLYQVRDLYISSRFTSIIHFVIMVACLFIGEFFIMLVAGMFNTSDLLFAASSLDILASAMLPGYITPYQLIISNQSLILSLFLTVIVYLLFVYFADSRRSYNVCNLLNTVMVVVIVAVSIIAII